MTGRDDQLGTLANAALRYAEQGWAVFPVHGIRDGLCTCSEPSCKHPGKHPRLDGAFHNATTDRAAIEQWWTRWPDANIGFAPASAGIIVIDVDGPDGDAEAGKLGLLSEPTVTVETGRAVGGYHLYFRHPGGTIGNPNIGAKIDVRANGGYVIVPPSVHHTGKRYKFDPARKEVVASLPPGVVGLLKQSGNTSNGERAPVRTPAEIPEGSRNNTLFRLGCAMREKALEEPELTAALVAANSERCKPSLKEKIVIDLAERICATYPAGAIRVVQTGYAPARAYWAPGADRPRIPRAVDCRRRPRFESLMCLKTDRALMLRWLGARIRALLVVPRDHGEILAGCGRES